jgi:hypothetical protein
LTREVTQRLILQCRYGVMKPMPKSSLNKITLVLILSLLLAAGLWAWLTLPPAQAQGGDEDLWRTLDTPFEHVGRVLEDDE